MSVLLTHSLISPTPRSSPLPRSQVSRLVLPPTRTLAIIEFTEPQDARSAFRALAYKKYQFVPLYLEWAPRDIFSPSAPTLKDRSAMAREQVKQLKQQKKEEKKQGKDAKGPSSSGKAADPEANPKAAGRASKAAAAANEDDEEEGALRDSHATLTHTPCLSLFLLSAPHPLYALCLLSLIPLQALGPLPRSTSRTWRLPPRTRRSESSLTRRFQRRGAPSRAARCAPTSPSLPSLVRGTLLLPSPFPSPSSLLPASNPSTHHHGPFSAIFSYLQVARKKGPDGQSLSMGFGFVEVDSEEVAKVVIQQMQVGGREQGRGILPVGMRVHRKVRDLGTQ